MLKIREVKTASGKTAVQVYYLHNRKRIIVKHFGSSDKITEIDYLKQQAQQFLIDSSSQLSLFPSSKTSAYSYLDQYECVGFYYRQFYNTIQGLIAQIGLDTITTSLLKDLIAIRILEPASKTRSIELINKYFGIQHRRQNYYEEAKRWISLKNQVLEKVYNFAQQEYSFNYSILFYDVTTLYFETFEGDELRVPGFSKDGKSQQPQILIGLMVNREGFPISYDIFPGNTFEGHTILPVLQSFIKEKDVKRFTVVADAAMISQDNIRVLRATGIHYIVGARLGNLSNTLFQELDAKIERTDGKTIRINTDKGYLICSFSKARFKKDKYEMEKQISKAQSIIESPSKNNKAKFVRTENQKLELNQNLINRTTRLLGLKGYYTDLPEQDLSNKMVIERYHELYKIEQAFRVAKSDLETRPIFHFKEDPIKLHILICFIALVISKHIEIKTELSIRRFITEMKIADARMLNKFTMKEVVVQGKTTKLVQSILTNLNLLH